MDISSEIVSFDVVDCEGPEAKGWFDATCSNDYKIHLRGNADLTIRDPQGNTVDAMPCTPSTSPFFSLSNLSVVVNN